MTTTPSAVLESIIGTSTAALVIYLSLVLLTRLSGLRSFSKLSSFDFAITVAFGSVIGGVLVSENPPLLEAVVGLVSLYLLQMVIAVVRRRFPSVQGVVDNRPILLMAGTRVIEENLARAELTPADLRAKLREANVLRYDQILAVVMETTGDVSVLHGQAEGDRLDLGLLEGVAGTDKLPESEDS